MKLLLYSLLNCKTMGLNHDSKGSSELKTLYDSKVRVWKS